jgi:pimeloyl-ACP methyl ester carboxylesterase
VDHESVELGVGAFRVHADRWDGGQRGQVLLIHGLGGNSITWHGVAPELARQLGVRVLAIDLPGFGASRSGAHVISMRVLATVVDAVMRAESLPNARWVLAGNSLGGLLALELACRFPERIAAVNLAALALPLAWGRQRAAWRDVRQYVAVALPWQGRRLVARYVNARGVPGVVDDPVRLLFRNPGRLDPVLRERLIAVSQYRLTWAEEAAAAYERATRSLGLRLLWPALAARYIRAVRAPVQSIYGSHDPLYPLAAWEMLERMRPDWAHVRLPDIGHVPQLEAAHEFTTHFASWLAPHLTR